jgi:A118 family predicted phage portal protein|uniref:Portal protein n=1 Tax=Siphoviridae sp. ctss15 TaxID=2825699 RepID=A0A8S5TR68_9CAUD|nr:MAG TPA: portal protein [Siphoviridae sp. ctss15]
MGLVNGIVNTVKRFFFPQAVAEREFGASPAVSLTMEQHIGLWYAMMVNTPPWQNCDVKAVGLPAAICREVARPTLVEFTANITGSKRADYLNENFQTAKENFNRALELGLALGGVALKPYIYGDNMLVDVTGAAGFQPTKFDPSGRCIGGVFKDKPVKVNGTYYVRLESHELNGTTYTIKNKAYYSDSAGSVGADAQLTTIPEWADIEPEVAIENVDGPLFAYFKPPIANTADSNSMCGMSIYGDAATVELIKQADEQWERLRWEYKSSERKVLMDGTSSTADMFNKRLFEIGLFSPNGDFFQHIEPQIRDDAIYRGFQNTLRRVEFNIGLSYGDISDPQTIEKTATEIRSSKQRKYVLVSSIQAALAHTFDSLIYAMDVYASLYGLAPAGDYEATYDWGDSILDDQETKDKEFSRDLQLTSAGVMNPWELRAKYFNEDEDTAKAALPTAQDMVTEQQQEVE